MSREVADLRVRLEEASLRSDAYLQAGYPEEAAEVVDEQRRLISRFRARLEQSMSEAAVEAEAERVLAAVPGSDVLSDRPTPTDEDSRLRPAPALLSAFVAGVLALVALGSPAPRGMLSGSDGPATTSPDEVIVAAPGTHPDAVTRAVESHGGAGTERISRVSGAGLREGPVPPAPEPSPTHGIVGLIGGLVDAADTAVRDVIQALLKDGHEPPVIPVEARPASQVTGGDAPDDTVLPTSGPTETVEVDETSAPVESETEPTDEE